MKKKTAHSDWIAKIRNSWKSPSLVLLTSNVKQPVKAEELQVAPKKQKKTQHNWKEKKATLRCKQDKSEHGGPPAWQSLTWLASSRPSVAKTAAIFIPFPASST